jgi:hypothetical protein
VGNTCAGGGQQPPTSGAPASPQNLRIFSSELRDLPLDDFAAPALDKRRAQRRDLLHHAIAG